MLTTSVSRDILLHKITYLNISGNFFDVLSVMYNNSVTKIKTDNLLVYPWYKNWESHWTGARTSPDLFKIFIRDIYKRPLPATQINKQLPYTRQDHRFPPSLGWRHSSLSSKPTVPSTNLNILQKFYQDWGLQINIKKTKIITFYPTKQKPQHYRFKLGDGLIEH